MGLSSSKNTTKENTTQNSSQQQSATQQPIVPPWLMGPVQNYVGAIDALFGRDPQGFVAPAAPLQLMGWENAPALGDWRGQARTAAEIAAHAARQPAFRVNRPAPAAAATGQATFYQPPAIDPASLVSGQGYRAPRLADAASYAAARPAPLAPVRAASILDAPAAAMPMGAPDGPGAFQAADAGAPLAAWRNPYTEGVIEASLQDYRSGVDRQAARLAANAARNGALGGSRFGLAEGQFAADAARGEGALSAQLRDQGFRQAAELARFDTGLRQQAGLANYQGGLRQALDQAARDDAAGQHGAAARNQYGLAQAGLDEGAARFGAASATQASLANADAQNRFALAEAGLGADAARYGAQAANQFGLANLAALNDMERLNSGHEWQGALADHAGNESAAQRGLQAAQVLGGLAKDYGAGTRADLGEMAQLGEQQRGIEQQQALAEIAYLQAIGQLAGMTPYDILVGRQVDGTTTGSMTGTGTSVTKSTPSLFSQMLAAGQLAAKFL